MTFLADAFWSLTFSNVASVAVTLGFLVTLFILRHDRRKEWQGLVEEQASMHTENRLRMEALLQFQKNQEDINRNTRHTLNEIRNQGVMMVEIAKGFDRRLQMMENRQNKG